MCMRRKIVRIPAHVREDLVLGDRERHRPGRIEIDGGDVGGQRRRRLVDLADDDAIAALDLVVRDRLDEGGRNVHHDVALGEDEIHAEQALDRGFELLDARADRDVEGLQGLRADAAGRLQPVAQLEALDAFDHGRVVERRRPPLGRHVVADDKTPAQQRHVRPARPRRELGVGRQARPAAADLDGRIAQQRFLDALIGALVEYRLGRERQRRRRTRFGRRRGLCGPRRCGLAGSRVAARGQPDCWPAPSARAAAQARAPPPGPGRRPRQR